jgi:hypothetical protein
VCNNLVLLLFLSVSNQEIPIAQAAVIRSLRIDDDQKGLLLMALIKPGMNQKNLLGILGEETKPMVLRVGPLRKKQSYYGHYHLLVTWAWNDEEVTRVIRIDP